MERHKNKEGGGGEWESKEGLLLHGGLLNATMAPMQYKAE